MKIVVICIIFTEEESVLIRFKTARLAGTSTEVVIRGMEIQLSEVFTVKMRYVCC